MSKPFVIRVSVMHDGQTSHRTYSRDAMALSRQAFCEYALGNLMSLVSSGYTDSLNIGKGISGVRLTPLTISAYAVDIVRDISNKAEVINLDENFRIACGIYGD